MVDAVIDIRELLCGSWLQTHHVIYGGGGLLYPSLLPILEEALRTPRVGKAVFWGAGLNMAAEFGDDGLRVRKGRYPDFMRCFDLVGCRDTGNPWEWVPCVSCMSPYFDMLRAAPTLLNHPFVYSHKDDVLPSPHQTNDLPAYQWPEVLMAIATHKSTKTNTYHGAYWTMLMNRSLELVSFTASNRLDYLPEAGSDLLMQCRGATTRFYRRVVELLSS